MSNRKELTRQQKVDITMGIMEKLNAAINATRKQDIRDKLIQAKEDILDIMYPKEGDYKREEPK